MRKFNHVKALKIAWDIIYVASFIALMAFTITSARESQVNYEIVKQQQVIDCMNCDEVD